jgi:hypothetical protein
MRRMLVACPSRGNLVLSERIRRSESAYNIYVGYDPCRLQRFEEYHAASLFNGLGIHEITDPTTWCLEGHASHHLPTYPQIRTSNQSICTGIMRNPQMQ